MKPTLSKIPFEGREAALKMGFRWVVALFGQQIYQPSEILGVTEETQYAQFENLTNNNKTPNSQNWHENQKLYNNQIGLAQLAYLDIRQIILLDFSKLYCLVDAWYMFDIVRVTLIYFEYVSTYAILGPPTNQPAQFSLPWSKAS